MNNTSLQEITAGLDELTPDKLQSFIREMTETLLELKERLESPDAEAREEGLRSAWELREALARELETLAQTTGVEANLDALEPEYAFVQEEIERLKELFPKRNR